MSIKQEQNPYSLDANDATIVGIAVASSTIFSSSGTEPKTYTGRIASTLGLVLGAVGGIILYKWLKHQVFGEKSDEAQKSAGDEAKDVRIICDSRASKKANEKINLAPSDFETLPDELINAGKTGEWQKKVAGEDKTAFFTAQKK